MTPARNETSLAADGQVLLRPLLQRLTAAVNYIGAAELAMLSSQRSDEAIVRLLKSASEQVLEAGECIIVSHDALRLSDGLLVE